MARATRSWLAAPAAVLLALICSTAQCVSAEAPGLAAYCNVQNHGSSLACTTATNCQVGDTWWQDSTFCTLPGSGSYPYANVCQGSSQYPNGVYTQGLTDRLGNNLGRLQAWRDYNNRLQVTISLDGQPAWQPTLYRDIPGMSFYLAVWDGWSNNPLAVYGDNQMPKVTPFACFSFSIDLTKVCDPSTSVWDPVGGCTCQYGGQGSCPPPRDISGASNLNVLYTVRTLNNIVNGQNCGTFASGSPISQFSNSSGSFVFTQPSCGNRPPSPSPPAPPPSPPAPLASPSLPPWPSPVAPYTGTVTVTVTSYQRPPAATDCQTLAGYPLAAFYSGRASYAGQSCTQTTSTTGYVTSYITALTLYYSGAYSGSDINYLYQSMQPEYTWRSVVSNMAPGCSFVAQYQDSLGNSYRVATSSSATSPAPRLVFADLACPLGGPPSPPAPPPPPPSPSPPPPPSPVCAMYVYFQLTPGYVLDAASCSRFANQVSFLFNKGLPTSTAWRCDASETPTVSAVASYPSGLYAAAFNANFNDSSLVILVASQWLPVDYSGASPRVQGCGARMFAVNSCGMPTVMFDGGNAPCFACP